MLVAVGLSRGRNLVVTRSHGPPTRRPRPVSITQTVRGRARDVRALTDGVIGAFASDGWAHEPGRRQQSPLRHDVVARGEERLTVTVTKSPPHRLHLPSAWELTVVGEAVDTATVEAYATALSFTPMEIEALARDMALTAMVPDRLAQWLPMLSIPERPLAGLGGIFTIHHQTDFVLLLEVALQLGIDPALTTVIDKEYCYEYSRRVDAHVRRKLGVPVYGYSEIEKGLSDHIRRVDEHKTTAGAPTWTQTVVVDDGGYILPRLRKSFPSFLSLFKGVVEQTASGIWALEPFADDIPIPVFSVAESELKQAIEAHGVAQAGVTNVRRLLPQEKFDGRPAVVVGFGRVGQATSEVLRRNNVDVHVVEIGKGAQATARERGFRVSDDLLSTVAAVAPRYLFSCARPGAVHEQALLAIPCDCALISMTSRDVAIDKVALKTHFDATPLGTLGTRYARDGVELLLLADGYPANFHYAESMPNQQSDIVMASLLVGAVALVCGDWSPGNDAAGANAMLNEGTLLTDFMSIRPPLGPA